MVDTQEDSITKRALRWGIAGGGIVVAAKYGWEVCREDKDIEVRAEDNYKGGSSYEALGYGIGGIGVLGLYASIIYFGILRPGMKAEKAKSKLEETAEQGNEDNRC